MTDEVVEGQVEDVGTTPEEGGIPLLDEPSEGEVAASPEEPEAVVEEPDQQDKKEEEEPTVRGRSSAFQKLLDKYGGDEEKFAEGMWNLANSSAAVHTELRELKESLQQKVAPTPTATTDVEHPDIPWLVQQITALDEKARANVNERDNTIPVAMNKITFEMARLQGQAENADDFDKSKIERKIENLQREYERHKERYYALNEAVERAGWDRNEFGRRLRLAQSEQEQMRAQQQQVRELTQEQMRQATVEFASAIDEAAKSLKGVDKDHMESAIRAEITFHARKLAAEDPNAPGIDIPEFVRQRATAYAKAMGLAQRSTSASVAQQKQQISGKRQVASGEPSAKSPSSRGWTAEQKAQYYRDRAAKLMP